MTARLCLTVLLAVAIAGCDSGTPTTCDAGGTVQTTDVTVGTGSAVATVNSTVGLRYVGRLADGQIFDQSDAVTFSLANTIPGFRLGVSGMKIGGRRTIVIPANLAYGANPPPAAAGRVQIPACATLTFDVTLLDVR